jgi:methyl-accepting chemotaxis protein
MHFSFPFKINFREKKIQLSILMIIIAIITQCSVSMYLSFKKDFLTAQLTRISKNNLFIQEKFSDHIKWAEELIESIAENKDFQGELDRNKTDFAKWYFSFSGSKEYWAQDDEKRTVFDKIGSANLNLHNTARMIYGADSQKEKLEIFTTQSRMYLNEIHGLMTEFISRNQKEMHIREKQMETYRFYFNIFNICLGIVISIFVIFLGFNIIKIVNLSVHNFMDKFRLLSNGDLSAKIDTITKDEYGELIRQYNAFIDKISHVITNVKNNSENLSQYSKKMNEITVAFSESANMQSAATEEMSSSIELFSAEMTNISNATSQQAERLESLVSVISEMSKLIKLTDEHIGASSTTVHTISEDAQAGEETLSQMKLNIDAIGKSSEEITGIVLIINEISEQINLLSLNAAIEAARAGDSGRGFAVVASEITKLAARTAQSISSIDTLIKRNKKETTLGISRVAESVERIRKIMDGVKGIELMMNAITELTNRQSVIGINVKSEAEKVSERGDDIQGAVYEQQKSVEEIKEAITDIAEQASKSSEGADRIAENIAFLEKMAAELHTETGYFKI